MKEKDGNPRLQKEKKTSHLRWVVRVFLLAIVLSAVMSFASEAILEGTGFLAAVLVLVFFIFLGIVFDVIGVSCTSADPSAFYSMAAHRTKGAKEAIWLLKHSERVSSICNDVVGDICGIVSGSTAAVLILLLQNHFSWNEMVLSIAVTALISGLTIGGKALSKQFAIRCSKDVIFFVARILCFFHVER